MKNKRIKHWSQEEYDFIRSFYPFNRAKWCSENIGTGRTVASIRHKALKLGIKSDPSWNEIEIKFLTQNYGKLSYKEISSHLDRTEGAIDQMAIKLKIKIIYYKEWTFEEITLLSKEHPIKTKAEIEGLFPDRNWMDIREKAEILGLKRNRRQKTLINGKCEKLLLDTNESLYWIGFLLADGHFSKINRLTCVLSEKDADHLSKLAKFLETTMKRGPNGKYRRAFISILDTLNVGLIKNKYNLHNNKTINPPNLEIFKALPDNLYFSMMAGFIDGDGRILKRKSLNVSQLIIKNYYTWLPFLNLFIERVNSLFKEACPIGIINNSGYARVNLTKHTALVALKNMVNQLNLPLMERKWREIDENYIGKYELLKSNRIKIREIIMNNCSLSGKEILDKNPSISRAVLYQEIKALRS